MAVGVILLVLTAGTFVQSRTIIDVLTQHRETTLLGLIQAAGLTDTLQSAGPFTIFAPSNQAFYAISSHDLVALKNDPVALADLLKYHVVSGKVMYNDLKINEKQLDSVAGPKIRVNYYMYNRHVAVEGSLISTSQHDYQADNGVVHIIRSVMHPSNGTITDLLASNPQFSTLKAAVDAVGLTDALNDGPYTLLAPTDSAFEMLGNDTVKKLLEHPDILKSVLLYHVIHGTLYSTGMHSGALHNLEEADREHITASFNGAVVQIDGARVSQRDMSTTNGVVHAINRVLIPSSLKATIQNLSYIQ